jgi:pimeloyl-ACP methyl ester carboxylesterase
MTAITDLTQKIVYPLGASGLPIVVLMHGWNEEYAVFPDYYLERIANYGFVVCAVNMRGRSYLGYQGTNKDGCRREIQDIVDGVIALRADSVLGPKCSATRAAIVGSSGGGANALAAACKFPDFFNVAVAYFGVSDFGRNGTDGWYYNNDGTDTAGISDAFGGAPNVVPNAYYAADATAAIANFTGGYLYLYADQQDTVAHTARVPWVHANRIKTAMDNASLTNYLATFSNTGDANRYNHGIDYDNAAYIAAETVWAAKVLSQAVWTVPASGTHTVIGYIVTKRYNCWLRARGTTLYGLDAAATVAYGGTPNHYTVTPLTGAIDVTITQADAKIGSATNISTATDVTVS